MALHVAKGLPTTKQTVVERPAILRKSQPTIGEPTASRWPTLAEVITNAGNGIKPSTSLLDMLHSGSGSGSLHSGLSDLEKVKMKIDNTVKVKEEAEAVVTSPAPAGLSNMIGSSSKDGGGLHSGLSDLEERGQPVTMASTAAQLTSKEKIPATVIDVADLGITDFGWNEDNIKLDFITGKQLIIQLNILYIFLFF